MKNDMYECQIKIIDMYALPRVTIKITSH